MLIAGALIVQLRGRSRGLPAAVARLLPGTELSPLDVLLLVNLLFLVLGCLFDADHLLLVVVPFLLPAAHALGIDLVHFGVVIVVNIIVGLITPPYGVLLFIVASLSRQPLMAVVRETMPFVYVLIAALAFLTYVPDSVLWLPRVLGYKG